MTSFKTVQSSFLLIALICYQVVFFSCKQTESKVLPDHTKLQAIDSLISAYSDYAGFNGSVLIAHEGEVIYKKGFGLAHMEWDIPNDTNTKFRIASITKPFTAILIMQLVAEKKLDLNKPITTYLPNYPKTTGDRITIHQLLTHTSGIVRDYESAEKTNQYPDRQRPEILIKDFWDLPLEFEPGERFAYSNSGYLILGSIIEEVTGTSYEELLKEKISSPLEMKNTGVDKHRPITKNRAEGYFKGFGEYYNSDYNDLSSITAVGNIHSTVEDLFLLDQALYGEQLLQNKYIDLMFSKHIADPDYGGHYGYGWEIKEKPIGNGTATVKTIGHSGSLNGFCALFTRIPTSNSTIILLNNTRRAYLNSITTAVTGILNDQPYDFPKKPLAKFMTQVIEKDGIEEGISFYKHHKDHADYYVSETELIVAGYRFLHAGNAEDAAAVFRLSIEIFPDRDNPYDSYAEALMTLEKNDEAIKNYKKSLELNPNNNNAKKMLMKLE